MSTKRDGLTKVGHFLVLGVCIYWAGQVLPHLIGSGDPPWIPLDYATLIFHEAGHWIFYFFGMFLYVLGGSLMQLLVPITVTVAFYRQQDFFAAGFGFFWLGDSLVNLSFYVADARAQQLQLLSDSGIHDWNWLLTQTNLLPYDTLFGQTLHAMGVLIIVLSLVGMGYALYREWLA